MVLGPVSCPAEIDFTTAFALRKGKFSRLGGDIRYSYKKSVNILLAGGCWGRDASRFCGCFINQKNVGIMGIMVGKIARIIFVGKLTRNAITIICYYLLDTRIASTAILTAFLKTNMKACLNKYKKLA